MPDNLEPGPTSLHEDVPESYVLKLFITGMTPRSLRAINKIKLICSQHLEGRHELEIIDIYQHPNLATADQVIASPTLLRIRPLPMVRLLGDLADTAAVLTTLGISPANDELG